MAFTKQGAVTPVSIQDMRINLLTHHADTGEQGAITFEIDVLKSDGTTRTLTGNLVPHLTAQQISQLQTFMANLRTQAETQIL